MMIMITVLLCYSYTKCFSGFLTHILVQSCLLASWVQLIQNQVIKLGLSLCLLDHCVFISCLLSIIFLNGGQRLCRVNIGGSYMQFNHSSSFTQYITQYSFGLLFLGVVHFRVVHLGSPLGQSMDWGSVFCPSPLFTAFTRLQQDCSN